MSSNVIQLHTTKQAKAQGVFGAVNIAARRMGLSCDDALRAAIQARETYQRGGLSPDAAVERQKALLRRDVAQVLA